MIRVTGTGSTCLPGEGGAGPGAPANDVLLQLLQVRQQLLSLFHMSYILGALPAPIKAGRAS